MNIDRYESDQVIGLKILVNPFFSVRIDAVQGTDPFCEKIDIMVLMGPVVKTAVFPDMDQRAEIFQGVQMSFCGFHSHTSGDVI